jgi:hypothetical protein
MSGRKFLLEGFIVALGLFVMVALSVLTAEESLSEQSNRTQLRLQKAISTIIEHAHNAKDDLAVQQTIHGLGEAPGILFASVVGKDGLFLAHSQPTLLGKPFHRSRMPVVASPLGGATDRWGTLLFAASDPNMYQNLMPQMSLYTMGAFTLWTAWMYRRRNWSRYVAKLDADILDTSKVSAERQAALERLERSFAETQKLWAARLQDGVNKISQGILFLDQNQRIAAINTEAMRLMALTTSPLGRSWLDTAILQACGVTLEKSLAQPGSIVECPIDNSHLKLQFDTINSISSGTWVTILESKELVK